MRNVAASKKMVNFGPPFWGLKPKKFFGAKWILSSQIMDFISIWVIPETGGVHGTPLWLLD